MKKSRLARKQTDINPIFYTRFIFINKKEFNFIQVCAFTVSGFVLCKHLLKAIIEVCNDQKLL